MTEGRQKQFGHFLLAQFPVVVSLWFLTRGTLRFCRFRRHEKSSFTSDTQKAYTHTDVDSRNTQETYPGVKEVPPKGGQSLLVYQPEVDLGMHPMSCSGHIGGLQMLPPKSLSLLVLCERNASF